MKDELFSPELIRSQLRRLLESVELRNSIVLSRFLQFNVEEKLAGRQDHLKEYTIAIKVIGKHGDFNPQTHASSNRCLRSY